MRAVVSVQCRQFWSESSVAVCMFTERVYNGTTGDIERSDLLNFSLGHQQLPLGLRSLDLRSITKPALVLNPCCDPMPLYRTVMRPEVVYFNWRD